MSLIADALQPFIVRGLTALEGRPLGTLQDVIIAPKASYNVDLDNPVGHISLDFRDPSPLTMAVASDFSRLCCASLQTLANIQGEMPTSPVRRWTDTFGSA